MDSRSNPTGSISIHIIRDNGGRAGIAVEKNESAIDCQVGNVLLRRSKSVRLTDGPGIKNFIHQVEVMSL
jgi:hypothetical protein